MMKSSNLAFYPWPYIIDAQEAIALDEFYDNQNKALSPLFGFWYSGLILHWLLTHKQCRSFYLPRCVMQLFAYLVRFNFANQFEVAGSEEAESVSLICLGVVGFMDFNTLLKQCSILCPYRGIKPLKTIIYIYVIDDLLRERFLISFAQSPWPLL